MDALDTIFGNTKACTATVKCERDGKTYTAKMLRGVTAADETAIGEAATHGTNFAWKAAVNGRPVTNKRDDTVSGAAARSAVYSMLGYAPPKEDAVPDATRRRARPVEPSVNGTGPTAETPPAK